MKKLMKGALVAVGLSLAVPAYAADVEQDAKDAGKNAADTARQGGHRTAREARRAKPGKTSLNDQKDNAKSKAASERAQGRKKARHAKKKVQRATEPNR